MNLYTEEKEIYYNDLQVAVQIIQQRQAVNRKLDNPVVVQPMRLDVSASV